MILISPGGNFFLPGECAGFCILFQEYYFRQLCIFSPATVSILTEEKPLIGIAYMVWYAPYLVWFGYISVKLIRLAEFREVN